MGVLSLHEGQWYVGLEAPGNRLPRDPLLAVQLYDRLFSHVSPDGLRDLVLTGRPAPGTGAGNEARQHLEAVRVPVQPGVGIRAQVELGPPEELARVSRMGELGHGVQVVGDRQRREAGDVERRA